MYLIVVFRGSAATLARDGPGSAAYFAVYEYTKRKLTPEGQTLSLPAVIMAGGIAGTPPLYPFLDPVGLRRLIL